MDKDHIVIAISSISGGGKSTVIHKLVTLLDDAISIHFDDYQTPDTYPKDPAALLNSGADFNVIKSPLLAQHLQALRRGEKITSPRNGNVVFPARYIIFEGPLGRAQQETGQYIDFQVFIDTPLEVGLARRFARIIANLETEEMSRDELLLQLKSIGRLADNYLLWMRRSYLAQLELVKPTSDLVLDWELSVDDLAQAIITALTKAKMI